jgi:hypothetical protein
MFEAYISGNKVDNGGEPLYRWIGVMIGLEEKNMG